MSRSRPILQTRALRPGNRTDSAEDVSTATHAFPRSRRPEKDGLLCLVAVRKIQEGKRERLYGPWTSGATTGAPSTAPKNEANHHAATTRSAGMGPRTRRNKRPRWRRTETDTLGATSGKPKSAERGINAQPVGTARANDQAARGARRENTQAAPRQPATGTPTEPGREPRNREAEKK